MAGQIHQIKCPCCQLPTAANSTSCERCGFVLSEKPESVEVAGEVEAKPTAPKLKEPAHEVSEAINQNRPQVVNPKVEVRTKWNLILWGKKRTPAEKGCMLWVVILLVVFCLLSSLKSCSIPVHIVH